MRTALITGGAKRIGKEIALHLANQGWKIIIHYNSSATEAQELKKLIGDNAELIHADFSDPKQIENLEFECDLLINNAAYFKNDTLENFSHENFIQHMNVNLYAPMKLTKKMKKGIVVNILDKWALDNPSNFLTYTLSKKVLEEFTKIAAKQLKPDVRVNAISPGASLFKEGQSKEVYEELQKKYPGSVKGICKAVDFILSDESLNGEIVCPLDH